MSERTVRLTHSQRVMALQVGADVLQSRFPQTHQASVKVQLGRDLYEAHAVFKWPGVVEVRDRWDGGLLARSMPGCPRILAEHDFS